AATLLRADDGVPGVLRQRRDVRTALVGAAGGGHVRGGHGDPAVRLDHREPSGAGRPLVGRGAAELPGPPRPPPRPRLSRGRLSCGSGSAGSRPPDRASSSMSATAPRRGPVRAMDSEVSGDSYGRVAGSTPYRPFEREVARGNGSAPTALSTVLLMKAVRGSRSDQGV